MPRRNLSAERTEQILDAFERCVVRLGLGSSSLEQVAQEAGVQRSILRHYVGNRDDLVIAMARRLVARFRDQLTEMVEYIGSSQRVDRLLECLFLPPTQAGLSDVVVAEALIAAADSETELRDLMTAMIKDTVDVVQSVLAQEFPATPRQQRWAVAYGVVGICFNHESLSTLALPRRFRTAALASSRALIETLRAP